MRLRRGSIGVWGVALINPLSPERHLSWGGGAGGREEGGGLVSGFHYAAEGGALQKEQRKDIKVCCSVRTSWSSRTPLTKPEVNV